MIDKCLSANPRESLLFLGYRARNRDIENNLAVMRQAQGRRKPAQCNFFRNFLDMTELGSLGLEESTPRRRVVKQVTHLD